MSEAMNPTQRIFALVLLGGVFVMEGFDIAAMSLALPRLESALGLALDGFGWVFSALLIGLGAGGAMFAPLGDRFGRRVLIVLGCLAVAAATLATATSSSIEEFLIWRLITGIGLGAALPNVSALSAELAPERLRATLMAVVSAGIPLGIGFAGVLAPEIIAVSGWQGLFIVPGVFAALLALVLVFILEGGPPARAGEPKQAQQVGEAKAGLAARFPQLGLFQPPWLLPFAVFATMLSLNAMNLYYLNSWIPTVLPKAGFSLDDAARISGVVQFAGIAIGVGASLLIDNWKPGLTLTIAFGLMAASFAAVGLVEPSATNWTLLLMVGAGGASAGGMMLPALCAYLFPAHFLSSAIGMGVLVARLGAIAGPPLGEAIVQAEATPQNYFAIAGIPAALCALAALLVPMALKVREREEANG